MSEKIKSGDLAKMLGITRNCLLKRIRRGVMVGLSLSKDSLGHYSWEKDIIDNYLELHEQRLKTQAESRLSHDLKIAASIVRRIRIDKWPYDTDNETFANLKTEAKQLILDAIKGFKGPDEHKEAS